MKRLTERSMQVLVLPMHQRGDYCIRGFYCAAIFLISALALLAYYPILKCFFTGTDTLTLIETSRVDSFGDLVKIFSSPLMDGTDFTKIGLFYRPVSVLTYTFDSLLWGLDPFGFHLTNLLLHISVGFLLLVLVVNLSGGDFLFAGLATGIFILHPVLVESVPAIDRRHDLISSLFLLITLIFFIKGLLKERSRSLFLGFSAASYCLALGSKETAVVIPALVFVYGVLFSDDDSMKRKVRSALMLCGPYMILTLIYLFIRWHVLGGLGGYQVRPEGEWYQILVYLSNIISSYFQDLWYPVDFLNIADSQSVFTSTIALVFFTLLYTIIAFNIFGKPTVGLDRNCGCRLPIFLMTWCVLPLGLFLGTLTFGHRYMYMPAIPFSAMLALAIVTNVRSLREKYWVATHSGCLYKPISGFVGARSLILLLSFTVVISLVTYSPLCRRYGQWEDSARISSLFLKNLEDAVKTLPKNMVIDIYNLPDSVKSHRGKIPHAREVTYLRDYGVKSWLDLCYPDNVLRVIVHSRSQLDEFAGVLNVRIRLMGRKVVRVLVNSGNLRMSRLK
jgi:hypothetical protein